jgi:hypothetical protein
MTWADWIVCAVAFLVLIVATWWVLYGPEPRRR